VACNFAAPDLGLKPQLPEARLEFVEEEYIRCACRAISDPVEQHLDRSGRHRQERMGMGQCGYSHDRLPGDERQPGCDVFAGTPPRLWCGAVGMRRWPGYQAPNASGKLRSRHPVIEISRRAGPDKWRISAHCGWQPGFTYHPSGQSGQRQYRWSDAHSTHAKSGRSAPELHQWHTHRF